MAVRSATTAHRPDVQLVQVGGAEQKLCHFPVYLFHFLHPLSWVEPGISGIPQLSLDARNPGW
jgi:hypothetical protein